MKEELVGKIMKEFVGQRENTCSCLIDEFSEDKKAKGTKRGVIGRKIIFENYKTCLEATQIENERNYLEKNKTDINSIKKYKKQ